MWPLMVCLCHCLIKQFPVPIITMAANDSDSPQPVAFQMNTRVSLSTNMLKGQCALQRDVCQFYEQFCHHRNIGDEMSRCQK